MYLVTASVLVGGLYGRLPAAVASRVFAQGRPSLLRGADFRRPWTLNEPTRLRATVVQIVFAALSGAAAVAMGTNWVLIGYLWFAGVTVTLTLTDIDQKLIPNRILFPGTAIAVVLLAVLAIADGDAAGLPRAAGGAVAYFAFLLVVSLAARGGFGMGDVKLAVLLGLFVAYRGWPPLVVAALGAFILGGAISIVLLALRIKSRKDAIPFGPYLVAAAYIAIAAGSELADNYG